MITTPMTFCATVQAILHVGASPVLADIGSDGNIDPEEIKQRITKRTRAIIPVHLAGLPCEMKDIWAMGRERGIPVIEDAAHAAGAYYEGRPIGAGPSAGPNDAGEASDAVAFSFYATKNLTTGEGGMLTTHGLRWPKRYGCCRCMAPVTTPGTATPKTETGTTTYSRTDSNITSVIFRPPSASTS